MLYDAQSILEQTADRRRTQELKDESEDRCRKFWTDSDKKYVFR